MFSGCLSACACVRACVRPGGNILRPALHRFLVLFNLGFILSGQTRKSVLIKHGVSSYRHIHCRVCAHRINILLDSC